MKGKMFTCTMSVGIKGLRYTITRFITIDTVHKGRYIYIASLIKTTQSWHEATHYIIILSVCVCATTCTLLTLSRYLLMLWYHVLDGMHSLHSEMPIVTCCQHSYQPIQWTKTVMKFGAWHMHNIPGALLTVIVLIQSLKLWLGMSVVARSRNLYRIFS